MSKIIWSTAWVNVSKKCRRVANTFDTFIKACPIIEGDIVFPGSNFPSCKTDSSVAYSTLKRSRIKDHVILQSSLIAWFLSICEIVHTGNIQSGCARSQTIFPYKYIAENM